MLTASRALLAVVARSLAPVLDQEPTGQTVAIGDGANDLDMINESGLGIAFHAKPKVAAEAEVSIRHGDLTAVLYLQGYRRDQFVTLT